MIAHFPTFIMLAAGGHPHAAPHAHASPLTTAFFCPRSSPLTIPLTSEASTRAMLMLGFAGLGFAAFSVGMRGWSNRRNDVVEGELRKR